MAFTYFFRDLHILEVIRKHALPDLCSRQYIKIWDAGCAMGQEPYSLAMVLSEGMGHMYFRNVSILATDIDQSNLFEKIISEGTYPEDLTKRIPTDIFEKYFEISDREGHHTLIPSIRKAVKFKKHDLLSMNPPDQDFGLIVCKNVLLHFSEEQRIKVINMYWDALAPSGYLAFEQTQKMPRELIHLFEQVVSNAQVFRKIN